MLYNRRKKSVY